MDKNSSHSQERPFDLEVEAALETARAHAAAAGALAAVALSAERSEHVTLSRLASTLKNLSGQTVPGQNISDASLALTSAVDLVEARVASQTELSTNMLRLVAESLSSAYPHPQMVADTRRAVHNTPWALAPLSSAFSGLTLITRALSARHGRDIDLTLEAEGVHAPEAQMDDWRQAAMLMARFALDTSRQEAFRLAFNATSHGGAVSLSLDLPSDLHPATSGPLADLLIAGLDGFPANSPSESEALTAFAPLESIAARLGGSMALETTDKGYRLILIARRVQGVATDPVVRREASRQARRLSAARAVAA